MSYLDDASLVVIPSGYKPSTVFAVKPTDGTGDLTFTRSNDTATRVNSAGLIEKVRTNLYPRGSALLATGWTSAGATLTAGQTDPNGGTGALRVQLAAGAANYIQYAESGLSANTPLTRSLYIKAASAQSIKIADPTGTGDKTINLTTSYQRFDLVATANGSGVYGLYLENSDTLAKDFTIAFIQIETGDIATDYIATTTAAVSVGPVANVPRLDYLNSSCPRLLLEGQRTNINLYSEDLTNAFYFKNNCTIAANSVTSPDGFQNADTATFTSGGNFGYFYSFAGNSSVAFSFFVKKGNYTSLNVLEQFYFATSITFNLDAKTATGGGKVEDYGNGWLRCSWVQAYGAGQTVIAWQFSEAAGAAGFAYFYGFQIEAGAYATSYIPTLGSASTRGSDAASKTGISSLIGQTEGTLFAEEFYDAAVANNAGFDDTLVAVTDGTSNNIISIFHYGAGGGVSNQVVFFIRLNNVTQAVIFSSALTTGTYKLALAYKNNDVVAYINGVQIGTDTSATIPATSVVTLVDPITTNAATKTVRESQVLLFKTRLSNSDLAALTTL